MFASLSLCLLVGRLRDWRLFEILFPDHIVTLSDPLARGLDFFRVEHERRAVADQVDHKSVGRFGQHFRQLFQSVDFFAID